MSNQGFLKILPKELEARERTTTSDDWNDVIPTDPEEFYADFGYLQHSRTLQPVTKLADFQLRTWRLFLKYKRILEIKSNKIGETTKWLIVDFQLAMLPSSHPMSCRGFDQLVISQTKDLAKEHLRALRRLIIDSRKYSKYLIDKPSEIYENGEQVDVRKIMRDEQTKTSVIYLHNPDKPTRPSRIIALGAENPGSILSWMRVKNIHFSDPTATQGDYSASIHSGMTRLANTNGSMIIETVPGKPFGKVFDMWTEYRSKEWEEGDFKLEVVIADEAVKAGIILPEFLEAAKRHLGPQYDQYYNAKFGAVTGGVFLAEQVEACRADYEYNLPPLAKYPRSLGIDMGFGNSKSAFLGSYLQDGKIWVFHASEFIQPDFNDMVSHGMKLIMEWGLDKIYVDGSKPEYLKALKRLLGERTDYDNVIDECRKQHINYENMMRVVPVYFGQENLEMLTWAQQVVSERQLMIHKDFASLVTQMRIASTNEKGTLDKSQVSLDLIDALFLNLRRYHY